MPQHYTVPTTNPFAVLDDGSDVEDIILSKPEDVPEPVAPPKPARSAKFADTTGGAPRRDNAPRRPRNPTEGAAPQRPRRPRSDVVDNEPPAAIEGDDVRRPTDIRMRGGRGGARGGARGGPVRPVREGQREFDRHSGTGRGREMKKTGGGAHNWGNEFPDYGGEGGASGEWPATQDVDGGVVARQSSAEENAAAPAAVEEAAAPKSLTYDAYKASIEEKRAALPAAKEAEAADEERQKLLQNGYQIYTKESKQIVPERKQEDIDEDKHRPRTMHLAEVAGVNLNYRGGRGGRGRGRGGNNDQQSTRPAKPPTAPKEINLSDQQAFPTLQAH